MATSHQDRNAQTDILRLIPIGRHVVPYPIYPQDDIASRDQTRTPLSSTNVGGYAFLGMGSSQSDSGQESIRSSHQIYTGGPHFDEPELAAM